MTTPNEIYQLSKKYSDYTANNLSELIKTKSLSNQEENVVKLIKKMMLEAGFDEARIDGLGNVIGKIGNGPKVIAIDGHVDTVDAGNISNWEFDPFGGEIKNGYVFGRGTVDQKSGVASFISAGKIMKEIGLPNDLSVYFTGSIIEEDCDGLCWKYIIEEEGIKPECVIITEPTDLNIYRGQRGRMEMEVVFKGISSHGSAPERGKNAIYMGSRVALKIEELNERLKVDNFLGKGTIAVTEFKSDSPSLCAVSDYARFHLDRRLTWGENEELALSQINELLKDYDAQVRTLDYKITTFTGKEYGMKKYFPTWVIEESHPVIAKGIDCYKKLFNSEPLVDKWTFSTNGIAINGMHNIPIIGFGPGEEKMAHSPNEKVPVEHLVKAAAFYAQYCLHY
ncbi:MAG: YgeY family selenium metabolism-linked hydrolase [Ignavibacteriae bacterium HGW-Ignavibacteriae-2]|jgi:putative selenium metabolism hydrolase|nr:MAG: YgeY family selenium metabolism-linked hydrolase [Ignavibacteriae bacterium HGW-Ignavibacteriae-2]